MRGVAAGMLALIAARGIFAAVGAATPVGLNNLGGAPSEPRFELPATWIWPSEEYGADICLWKYDRYAACSPGHDDNCDWDLPFLLDIAQKNHLKFTWWLITQNIGEEGSLSGRGNWPEWREAFAQGHAIETHTHTHEWAKGTRTIAEAAAEAGVSVEDYVEFSMYSNSIALIEEKIPGCHPSTLAYPGGEAYLEIANKYFVSGRGTETRINRADAVNYMNTKTSEGLNPAYFNIILGGKGGTKQLGSMKSMNRDKDRAELNRGWCVPFQHTEHTKNGEATSEYVEEVARNRALYELLGSYHQSLWIGIYPEVAKYSQSFATATLTIGVKTPAKITFTLTDQMRDDWYDVPLTVKIHLPSDWTGIAVSATQEGKLLDAYLVEHENAKYALVNAVPDRGEVTLIPAEVNSGSWDETSYDKPTYTYRVRFYETDADGTNLLKTVLAQPANTSAVEAAPMLEKSGYRLSWTTTDGVAMENITDDVDFTAVWTSETEPQPEEPEEPEDPEDPREVVGWFEVKMPEDAQVMDANWIDGVLVYTPSEPSVIGMDVVLTGRVQAAVGSRDKKPEFVSFALVFEYEGARLFPVVYTDGEWRRFGTVGIEDDAWVNWKVEFDFTSESSPRVQVTVGAEKSEWLPTVAALSQVAHIGFAGGAFGSFAGKMLRLTGGGEVIELVAPEFTKEGGAGFAERIGEGVEMKRVFALKVANPVKGLYYTVFTTVDLKEPFTAESESILWTGDEGVLTLEVAADTPSKFATVIVTHEKIENGKWRIENEK